MCACMHVCEHVAVCVGLVRGWLGCGLHPVPFLSVNGSLGSGASALGLSLAGWLCSKAVGSAEAGTTELGHSSESLGGSRSPRGLCFLKENLFMLMWVSLSLFYSVNSKVYSPVVPRMPHEELC